MNKLVIALVLVGFIMSSGIKIYAQNLPRNIDIGGSPKLTDDRVRATEINCPLLGQSKFTFNIGDNVGYCGIPNDRQHCLERYIYVSDPSGSVDEQMSESWDTRASRGRRVVNCKELEEIPRRLDTAGRAGARVLDGYLCIAAPFPQALKRRACPRGTRAYFYSELAYDCYAYHPFEAACLPGYRLSEDLSQNEVEGVYSIDCRLENTTDPFTYRDGTVPCGNSGAEVFGDVHSGYYECTYMCRD